MIKLITWEVDRSHAPADHGQVVDLTMMHSDMANTGIDSGCSKMWGVDPGGNHGFSVADGDESDILATIAQHIPHVRFDVEPMRDLDEVMATLWAIQQQVSHGEESHLRPGAEKCPTSSLIRADSQSTSSPEGQSPPQDHAEW